MWGNQPDAMALSGTDKFYRDAVGTQAVSAKTLFELLLRSPTARSLDLTERLVADFFQSWEAKTPTAGKEPPRTITALRGRLRTLSPLSPVRSDGPSKSASAPRYSQAQFVSACEEMQVYSEQCFRGVCIVGNGRSVLELRAGRMVDRFATVVRFNDFQINDYEEHIGRQTHLWVVSDWTCVKLLAKYPERTTPFLCAIPYRFMGKPYYEQRRKEIEEELTPAQLKQVRVGLSLEQGLARGWAKALGCGLDWLWMAWDWKRGRIQLWCYRR